MSIFHAGPSAKFGHAGVTVCPVASLAPTRSAALPDAASVVGDARGSGAAVPGGCSA